MSLACSCVVSAPRVHAATQSTWSRTGARTATCREPAWRAPRALPTGWGCPGTRRRDDRRLDPLAHILCVADVELQEARVGYASMGLPARSPWAVRAMDGRATPAAVICDHVLGQHLVEADSVGQVVRGHDADSSVATKGTDDHRCPRSDVACASWPPMPPTGPDWHYGHVPQWQTWPPGLPIPSVRSRRCARVCRSPSDGRPSLADRCRPVL